ncbi:MAG: ribonuclease P protein component [Candidatus Paceibacterota bacterium]
MREKTETFFKTVMKSGGLFSSPHLSLRAVKLGVKKTQVRVVISKKTIKHATARNLLRRRVRGLFEEVAPYPIEAIFYTKKGAQDISKKELREEISYLIKKI